MDLEVFEDIGCPPSEYWFRNCDEDSPLYALGCDSIKEPPALLGALKPAYPIILCITDAGTINTEIDSIDDTLRNQCDTSPDDICLDIDRVIGERCAQPRSHVCNNYRDAIETKCAESPESICAHNWPSELYQVENQVWDRVFDLEHIEQRGYAYNSQGDYFFRSGGLEPWFFRYVVFREGHFDLIETEDEFRAIFAPIETEEEALAYVQAVTGLLAYYGLEANSRYEYFVDDVIEDTHVDTVRNGYEVHLYSHEVFGCGPHFTYVVDFHVTPEGHLEQTGKQQVFKDTREDLVCAD